MSITQLEIVYKACLDTLKTLDVPYDSKYDDLLDDVIEHNEMDVTDLIDIVLEPLHNQIYNHEKYVYYRAMNSEDDEE